MTGDTRIYRGINNLNDLTFRMSQHTSSEVTVGYNTIRFECLRDRLGPK